MALTSMILGIASFPGICCWPVGIILAIGAVVLGHLAKKDIANNGKGGEGMAKAGLILGYIAIPLIIILVIIGLTMGDPENQGNFLKLLEQMQNQGVEPEPLEDPNAINPETGN